jgi:hypothetical protein
MVVPLVISQAAFAGSVYTNDFGEAVGTRYREWSSSEIRYVCPLWPSIAGVLPAPVVTNCATPMGERILGEFGGPMIVKPGEPGFNRLRVEQTVRLDLRGLQRHRALKLEFNLYVLKSWDGNSPVYGPDRWRIRVKGGPVLLDTTFSNNPKVATEGSTQDYPRPGSAPRSGAVSIGTLGYSAYFADSIYHFSFTFAHANEAVVIEFASSLFEGKGTEDESWGLGKVRVETVGE